jgi:hypothetical protein
VFHYFWKKLSFMKSALLYLCSALLLLSSCTEDRNIKAEEPIIIDPDSQLIYYWNFNVPVGDVTAVAPNFASSTQIANITYDGSGVGYMDIDEPGFIENARNGDSAENLLKVRNPSNTRSLLLSLPTNGFKEVVLQFALSRSNNGATTQNYSYTTDGINYITTGMTKTAHSPMPDPTIDEIALDFTGINAVNNNPNFKIKIDFVGDAAANPTGNNRFDNITLEGIPLLP